MRSTKCERLATSEGRELEQEHRRTNDLGEPVVMKIIMNGVITKNKFDVLRTDHRTDKYMSLFD